MSQNEEQYNRNHYDDVTEARKKGWHEGIKVDALTFNRMSRNERRATIRASKKNY